MITIHIEPNITNDDNSEEIVKQEHIKNRRQIHIIMVIVLLLCIIGLALISSSSGVETQSTYNFQVSPEHADRWASVSLFILDRGINKYRIFPPTS